MQIAALTFPTPHFTTATLRPPQLSAVKQVPGFGQYGRLSELFADQGDFFIKGTDNSDHRTVPPSGRFENPIRISVQPPQPPPQVIRAYQQRENRSSVSWSARRKALQRAAGATN